MALRGLVCRGGDLCIKWAGPPQLLARPQEGLGQVASGRPHPESTYPPEPPRGEEFRGTAVSLFLFFCGTSRCWGPLSLCSARLKDPDSQAKIGL